MRAQLLIPRVAGASRGLIDISNSHMRRELTELDVIICVVGGEVADKENTRRRNVSLVLCPLAHLAAGAAIAFAALADSAAGAAKLTEEPEAPTAAGAT